MLFALHRWVYQKGKPNIQNITKIANAVLGHCEVTVCLFVIESPNREFYKLTMKKGLIWDIKIIKLFFFLSLVFFLSFCLFLCCSHVLVFKKQAHIYVDDRRGALIWCVPHGSPRGQLRYKYWPHFLFFFPLQEIMFSLGYEPLIFVEIKLISQV